MLSLAKLGAFSKMIHGGLDSKTTNLTSGCNVSRCALRGSKTSVLAQLAVQLVTNRTQPSPRDTKCHYIRTSLDVTSSKLIIE